MGSSRMMGWWLGMAVAAAALLVAAPAPVQAGEDGIACSLCQDAIVDVEQFLQANSTVQEIVKILEDVCNLLPSAEKKKCLEEVQHIAPKLAEADDSIVTKYSPFALCSMLGTCEVDCCATPYLPEQIHLSITHDISEMVVMWSTLKKTPHPVVQYGLSPDNLNMTVNASVHTYNRGGWRGHLYTGVMTSLRPSTTYYYRVGDPTVAPDFWMKPAWSQVPSLHFTTRTAAAAKNRVRTAMIGDAGATDASMLSLAYITERVNAKDIDFLFHDGDIGYADGYQPLWDQYIRKIESIAGFVPYMTVQGNHEGFYDFKPYMARFAMPYKQSGSDSPLYYSFDYGNVHFVAVNSESEFGLAARSIKPDTAMYKWLRKDLRTANASRDTTPWIVVVLHRPLYCTENNRDCEQEAAVLRAGIEDLLHDYNVDLVIQAHRHNYQASYPVYKQKKTSSSFHRPSAPVYVVNGAAGNKEHMMGPGKKPWARKTLKQYGYAILDAVNATALQWTYHAAADNSVLDQFILTK